MSTVTVNETTIHDTLGSIIEHGKPGDVYHDLPTGSDRSIETFVMLSRHVVGETEKLAHPAGRIVGTFKEISTRCHGRSELAGRLQYAYRSAVTESAEASTEPGGMFIRRVFSVGQSRYLAVPDVPAKRYGKTKLLSIHREALVAEGVTTEGV